MEVTSLNNYQLEVVESTTADLDRIQVGACNNFGLDLDLPHPDTYLPETVDFPSSPSAMMKFRPDSNADGEYSSRRSKSDVASDSDEDERSFRAVIDHNSVRLRKDEWCDSANVSDADEYFEDFHLPMTHQNSMSTRRSFIRKIKSTDMNVPDAARIEQIVTSGQLQRHASVRRKIVPRPQDFAGDSYEKSSSSPTKSSMFASTPNATFSDSSSTDMISPPSNISNVEDCNILDDDTLAKIKDCLDVHKVKDLYTLGSCLADFLMPCEIDEILHNSHRYADVIGNDVLVALSGRRNQSRIDVRNLHNISTAKTSPDLIGTDSRKKDPHEKNDQKVKKRISILDDIIRTSMEDSDHEGELCDLDLVSRMRMQQIAPSNAAGDELLSPLSDSPVPTLSDDWDASSTSQELALQDVTDSSISERKPKPDVIPELSCREERDEERNWRSVVISGLERKIDLKVIEPYKKVLSHGGYQGDDCQTAIIVFSACFLPDRSRVDYDYVMEHLFLYVLTTLDQLVAEDYVLIYFHGATSKSCIPRFSWVKNCYQMIDRRLRKNLKRLYLVHPTLWLKAAVLMCRPFISAKFCRKIVYAADLTSLSSWLPMDHVCIPDRVKQYDFTLMIQELKRKKGIR